jgi:hypothetical protein
MFNVCHFRIICAALQNHGVLLMTERVWPSVEGSTTMSDRRENKENDRGEAI